MVSRSISGQLQSQSQTPPPPVRPKLSDLPRPYNRLSATVPNVLVDVRVLPSKVLFLIPVICQDGPDVTGHIGGQHSLDGLPLCTLPPSVVRQLPCVPRLTPN